MGGNAMKHVGVTRKPAAEYAVIAGDVIATLRALFPACACAPIQAYANKASFGDCDILIESDLLPANWLDMVREAFKPQDLVNNGGVVSFDFRTMQIDLISASVDDYAFAHAYFSFNDLGNLMGRIAHKMGFKYGHDGLWKLLRDKDQMFAEILVTRDLPRTFALLGYDYARFLQGFDELEDVFAYAASTPYFHRQIYQLDNRNANSRVRDAKRPSYNAFLTWIEDKPELDRYSWSSWNGGAGSAARDAQHKQWEDHVFNTAFPEAQARYRQTIDEQRTRQQAKLLWNGGIVAAHTGLQGKDLGEFMAACKTSYQHQPQDPARNFEQWIVTRTPEQIARHIDTSRHLTAAAAGGVK